MRYRCQFPGCKYETDYSSQINYHHIIPRENNGQDSKNNLISLCPNHHTKIYIPESKQGQHSIKGNDSIILNGWRFGTSHRRILEYIDCNNELQYIEERV